MLRRHSKTRSTVRLRLETLERRELMSAGSVFQGPTSFVYTETENTTPGQNAVIGFAQNAGGQLTQIGSFPTDGTGFPDTGRLGPQDSDKEVIASPDGRFLYAVNQGSNTIAAFSVQPDGSLTLLNNSPISSGGTEPVSLAIADGRLYVVNRGDEVQGQTGSIAPTITAFNIAADGTLVQNFADTTTLPLGLSPSQVLTTPTSNLLFVDTFTPVPLDNVPQANEILPFQIGGDGQLTLAPDGGLGDPTLAVPFVLGLTFDPGQNIIYAGLTGANEVGVFTFDQAGNLTLEATASVQGAAPCWTTVSPNGQFLYTVDTGSDSVGVLSLADPLHPVQIQEFKLGGPLNATGSSSAPRETTDFEFSFDPTGNYLYVIDHQTGTAGNFPDGNALHVLSVASNGTLSEGANSPVFLPPGIPLGADPQGVAVIAAVGPGATVVGNSLYLVGGNTNDQLNITPVGTSQTGSTGINVSGRLDNVHIDNQTFTGITTIFVIGQGGNDNIQFANSLTLATVISLGDGNDNLRLGNGANTVTVGNGNDNIQRGNGTNVVIAGDGNDQVQLGDGNNTVTLGTGNDNVQLGAGTNSVTAGAAGSRGNIQVQIGDGNNNFVSLLGNGNDQVQIGDGNNDSVSTLGNGNDQVQIGNGTSDSVVIVGTGHENVQTGTGSGTVHVTSGKSNVHLGSDGWTLI